MTHLMTRVVRAACPMGTRALTARSMPSGVGTRVRLRAQARLYAEGPTMWRQRGSR